MQYLVIHNNMKNLLIIVIIGFLALANNAQAQKKIKESDVIGTWKLNIDIDEAIQEVKNDLDEEDNLIGKLVLSSVSGLIDNIMEEIDIYLDFQKGGKLEILVNAFGEKEIEYSEWYITKKGELFIEDTEHIQTDNDRFVMTSNGIMVPAENYDEDAKVFLVRVAD
ncbi:MAG: hypothetical protein RIC03_17305 [Cyclobacteriaceae bacterium]